MQGLVPGRPTQAAISVRAETLYVFACFPRYATSKSIVVAQVKVINRTTTLAAKPKRSLAKNLHQNHQAYKLNHSLELENRHLIFPNRLLDLSVDGFLLQQIQNYLIISLIF